MLVNKIGHLKYQILPQLMSIKANTLLSFMSSSLVNHKYIQQSNVDRYSILLFGQFMLLFYFLSD